MTESSPPVAPRTAAEVLIADDAFASRQWLSSLLRQFMHVQIREARNGLEAVEAFRLRPPDIVFLDIDMPEMDGMSVLRDIRDTGKPTFVVMVTAVSRAEKVQEAAALGVGGFVVKPYKARRILEVLERFAVHAGMRELLRPL